MVRLIEIALFLAPFGAFVAWRLLLPAGGPSRTVLALSVALLLVMAGMLSWLSRENTLQPGVEYVPPHVENGVIVPGRGARP